jgi:FdhE protein
MSYVAVPSELPGDLEVRAERRWAAVLARRPDLSPAVALQRKLLFTVVEIAGAIDAHPLPQLPVSTDDIVEKLRRKIPALVDLLLPIPLEATKGALVRLCRELSAGGAGATADHIREALETRSIDTASLVAASLKRDQVAIRQGATHRGLAPDLVWLIAELATSPYANALQRALASDAQLRRELSAWDQGYCPACGSWPALAEVAASRRVLRCSFCAAGWELPSYACIYCGNGGETFVTAAPDEERKDRRVEVCGACGCYLKTVEVAELSPFPLLAISDLETMDLDIAAMEKGYGRPALRSFAKGPD